MQIKIKLNINGIYKNYKRSTISFYMRDYYVKQLYTSKLMLMLYIYWHLYKSTIV